MADSDEFTIFKTLRTLADDGNIGRIVDDQPNITLKLTALCGFWIFVVSGYILFFIRFFANYFIWGCNYFLHIIGAEPIHQVGNKWERNFVSLAFGDLGDTAFHWWIVGFIVALPFLYAIFDRLAYIQDRLLGLWLDVNAQSFHSIIANFLGFWDDFRTRSKRTIRGLIRLIPSQYYMGALFLTVFIVLTQMSFTLSAIIPKDVEISTKESLGLLPSAIKILGSGWIFLAAALAIKWLAYSVNQAMILTGIFMFLCIFSVPWELWRKVTVSGFMGSYSIRIHLIFFPLGLALLLVILGINSLRTSYENVPELVRSPLPIVPNIQRQDENILAELQGLEEEDVGLERVTDTRNLSNNTFTLDPITNNEAPPTPVSSLAGSHKQAPAIRQANNETEDMVVATGLMQISMRYYFYGVCVPVVVLLFLYIHGHKSGTALHFATNSNSDILTPNNRAHINSIVESISPSPKNLPPVIEVKEHVKPEQDDGPTSKGKIKSLKQGFSAATSISHIKGTSELLLLGDLPDKKDSGDSLLGWDSENIKPPILTKAKNIANGKQPSSGKGHNIWDDTFQLPAKESYKTYSSKQTQPALESNTLKTYKSPLPATEIKYQKTELMPLEYSIINHASPPPILTTTRSSHSETNGRVRSQCGAACSWISRKILTRLNFFKVRWVRIPFSSVKPLFEVVRDSSILLTRGSNPGSDENITCKESSTVAVMVPLSIGFAYWLLNYVLIWVKNSVPFSIKLVRILSWLPLLLFCSQQFASTIHKRILLYVPLTHYWHHDRYFFFFLLFCWLKTAKIIPSLVSYFMYNRQPIVPISPTTKPDDVTVIVPVCGMFPKDDKFRASIEKLLGNHVYGIFIVPDTVANYNNVCFALRNVGGGQWSVFPGSAGSPLPKKRHLIHTALQHVQTRITCVVDTNVLWGTAFLRSALAAFEDPIVSIVGSTRHVERNREIKSFGNDFMNYIECVKIQRLDFENTAAFNIDGGVSLIPSSTWMVRTEVVEQLHYRDDLLHEDWFGKEEAYHSEDYYTTRYFTNNGHAIGWINNPDLQDRPKINLPSQQKNLTDLAKDAEIHWRHIFSSLVSDGRIWGRHPWTSFMLFGSWFFDNGLFLETVMLLCWWASENKLIHACGLLSIHLLFKIAERKMEGGSIKGIRNRTDLIPFLISITIWPLLEGSISFWALCKTFMSMVL